MEKEKILMFFYYPISSPSDSVYYPLPPPHCWRLLSPPPPIDGVLPLLCPDTVQLQHLLPGANPAQVGQRLGFRLGGQL